MDPETIEISGCFEKADGAHWTEADIEAFNDRLVDMCEQYGYRFGGGVGPLDVQRDEFMRHYDRSRRSTTISAGPVQVFTAGG